MASQGRLLAWTPFEFAGSPILGDIQRALFYPLSLPFYLMPAGAAISVSLVVHSLIAAFGVYALGRQLGLERSPSRVAAVAFALGFWPVFRVSILTMNAALAWLPWLAFASLRLMAGCTSRRWALLALLAALQWLAGHPQLVYYTDLALVAIVLVHCRQPGWWRRAVCWALAMMVGLGLAAPQVLPATLVAQQTLRARGISLECAASYSLTPRMLWTAVSPFCYGLVGLDYPSDNPGPLWAVTMGPGAAPYEGDWSLQETCIYPGLVVWLLAGVALLRGGGRAWALAGGALLSLWLALGVHGGLFVAFYRVFPGADQFRTPSRITLLAGLALALLAGIGLQQAARVSRTSLLTLALAISALALAAPGPRSLLVIPLLALWAVALAPARLAMVALTLELAWVGHGYFRTVPELRVPEQMPVLQRLADMARGQRVALGTSAEIPGRLVLWAPRLGLESVQGWNPMALGHYIEALYFNEAGHFPDSQAERDRLVAGDYLFVLSRPATALTELLGVRFLLAPGGRILENPRALPRAWLVSRWSVAQGEEALKAVQEGRVDPREEALLAAPLGAPLGNAGGTATIRSQGWDYLELDCQLRQAGLLMTNLVYEHGWTVEIDGRSGQAVRAFHTLLAVPLPAGSQRVVLRYHAPGLTRGVLLAAASSLILVGVLLSDRFRRKPLG